MAETILYIRAFQSTLPVGGATTASRKGKLKRIISIHAPRGGSDLVTLPLESRKMISIHAPRGGSDKQFVQKSGQITYFNPRSPWGERPPSRTTPANLLLFQSTLPVGGATDGRISPETTLGISIHAPRGGSDNQESHFSRVPQIFQSTLPVGGATNTWA